MYFPYCQDQGDGSHKNQKNIGQNYCVKSNIFVCSRAEDWWEEGKSEAVCPGNGTFRSCLRHGVADDGRSRRDEREEQGCNDTECVDNLEMPAWLERASMDREIYLPEESSHVEYPPEVDLKEKVVKKYS